MGIALQLVFVASPAAAQETWPEWLDCALAGAPELALAQERRDSELLVADAWLRGSSESELSIGLGAAPSEAAPVTRLEGAIMVTDAVPEELRDDLSEVRAARAMAEYDLARVRVATELMGPALEFALSARTEELLSRHQSLLAEEAEHLRQGEAAGVEAELALALLALVADEVALQWADARVSGQGALATLAARTMCEAQPPPQLPDLAWLGEIAAQHAEAREAWERADARLGSLEASRDSRALGPRWSIGGEWETISGNEHVVLATLGVEWGDRSRSDAIARAVGEEADARAEWAGSSLLLSERAITDLVESLPVPEPHDTSMLADRLRQAVDEGALAPIDAVRLRQNVFDAEYMQLETRAHLLRAVLDLASEEELP